MTHPALTSLTLAEIRQRGRDARSLGLPYFSNPFRHDLTIEFELWVAKCLAWEAGWLAEDRGRTEEVQEQLREVRRSRSSSTMARNTSVQPAPWNRSRRSQVRPCGSE